MPSRPSESKKCQNPRADFPNIRELHSHKANHLHLGLEHHQRHPLREESIRSQSSTVGKMAVETSEVGLERLFKGRRGGCGVGGILWKVESVGECGVGRFLPVLALNW